MFPAPKEAKNNQITNHHFAGKSNKKPAGDGPLTGKPLTGRDIPQALVLRAWYNKRGNVMNRFLTLAVVLACSPVYASSIPVPTVEWIRQTGPIEHSLSSVSMSIGMQGEAYLAASTPDRDAILTKYDTAGDITWSRIGGASSGGVRSVSAGLSGTVFTGGWTGGPDFSWDAFVTKYDVNGSVEWTRQFGTTRNEHAAQVAADVFGNVYVSGKSEGGLGDVDLNSFLRKYGPDGSELWTRELDTGDDVSGAVVGTDALGHAYVTGRTGGTLLGIPAVRGDVFLAKYDGDGNLLWTRQIGTNLSDVGNDVSADGLGNVYIAGWTEGGLDGPNQGSYDAFVIKYDSEGNYQWTRQLGTSEYEIAESVAADGLGNVYVSGFTRGNLGPGDMSASDVFLAKYDSAGNRLWTQLYGTDEHDDGGRVSVAGDGSIYLAGHTQGSLGGPSSGNWDAFLIKLHYPVVIPEPSTGILLLVAAAVIALKRHAFSGSRGI